MKRSLTAALALIATVCSGSVARADLDSLLGDGTAAASHEAGSTTSSEVLPAPASGGISNLGSNFSDDFIPVPKSAEKRASRSSINKTLAAYAPQHAPVYPLPSPSSVAASPATDGYSVMSPSVNPYCAQPSASGDLTCRSGTCGSSCGCGKLLARNETCHLLGESECRPHRSPVLPPPGSLLQMFRSKNSYSGIWAGYADETRARRRNTSPHINGTWNACDDGGLIEPDCDTCGLGRGH